MAAEKRYPQAMMTTALLPWNADNTLDEALFRRELRHILAGGIRHVYILGTAGEGYDLNTEEYTRVVEIFREEMDGEQLHPMVCVMSMSTQLVIERIGIARRMGIREFQIVLPNWGPLNDGETSAFFHAVCDRFPDCVFMLYDIGRAGRVLEAPQLIRLAREIPNLAAVKLPQPNMILISDILMSDCPLCVYVMDCGWAYAAMMGDCGYIVAVSAPNMELAHRYFEAGLRRDARTLFPIHRELLEIRTLLFEAAGLKMDGAYDKLTLKLALPELPLRLRPPYESPDEASFQRLLEQMRAQYPHWKL